jgi:serine phosphatase RsbU (regulator of sigma subunit)
VTSDSEIAVQVVPDHGFGILATLLRASHLAGPDDLPALTMLAGESLGARQSVLYVVDYDQAFLVPLRPAVMPPASAATPIAVDGTLAGLAYSESAQHSSIGPDTSTLWTPVLDGSERLGVLQLDFAAGFEVDDALRSACRDVASLLGELVVTRTLIGDSIEKARRRVPLTLPAEMQWRQLPPLTFLSPRVAIAGILVPTAEVAGDSFDYAMNDDTLHVAVIDAMGHGMEATLLSAVAVSTLRNARRAGVALTAMVRAIDSAVSEQFGGDKFVTGIIGQLDVRSGWWTWVTCGHPAALLIRDGKVVKELDSVIGVPLGLGLLDCDPTVGAERLQPQDRLLLFTDGVIEARDSQGDFFGNERLVEFVARQAAASRPAAETLRRLNHAILDHQQGSLQDDATTVIIEWLSDS